MKDKSFLNSVVAALRILLYPVALLYGAVTLLRNKLYDAKFFTSIGFSLPVISVGNLSTGGTGKTPHIEYLIMLLQYRYKVATMSRGYKRYTKGFILAEPGTNALRIGDEPMQFFMKFPEVEVCVAEERLTGVPNLLQRRPNIEVILLDDAFQHRSVRPGLNILITDYSKPFYSDHVLPFGNLRESPGTYKRADVIIVSKCPQGLSAEQADQMKAKISPLPHQQVFFSGLRYGAAYNIFTREEYSTVPRHLILACGIARPEPLISYLEAEGAQVHPITYPDHHYFVTTDLEEIKAAYDNWIFADKAIVTTEKDAARLQLHFEKLVQWGVSIFVVPVSVNILFEQGEKFNELVNCFVEKKILSELDEHDYVKKE